MGQTMPQLFNEIAGYWMDGALRTLDGFKRGMTAKIDDPAPVTPYRVIFESGKVKVRHYEAKGPRRQRIPIVLVYALVKRPFVLDMQPGRSVVEFLTKLGFDVFLTDWIPPDAADAWRGFDAYVNGDLARTVRAVQIETGVAQLNVVGYCFGALLSLLYTAIHPGNVRNLITATLPFDMSSRDLPLYNMVDKFSDPAIESIMQIYGNCPSWMVNGFFTAMAPTHHAIDKYIGLHRNARREGYTEMFELFERWMNSDVALAGRIFKEMTGDVFKRNLLALGELKVGGETIDLKRVTCPLLNVVAEFDDVVHPKSSLPLPDHVGSTDKRNLTFPTGHLGAMVSSAAHGKLWPQIGQWLTEHSN